MLFLRRTNINFFQNFPGYENGISFFHTTGFEIAARAVAGDTGKSFIGNRASFNLENTEGAYEVYARALIAGNEAGNGTVMFGAALDWNATDIIGYVSITN